MRGPLHISAAIRLYIYIYVCVYVLTLHGESSSEKALSSWGRNHDLWGSSSKEWLLLEDVCGGFLVCLFVCLVLVFVTLLLVTYTAWFHGKCNSSHFKLFGNACFYCSIVPLQEVGIPILLVCRLCRCILAISILINLPKQYCIRK